MNGLIIVDKPLYKTSFDVIRDLRKKYNTRKMGHIGTLDPMATGVLPILVGEATKLSDYLMEHDKEYIAKLYLGEKRDTGDCEGKIIERSEVPKLCIDDIEKVLKSFLGESMQIPPMYSAIKVNGEKLYELARQGKNVERTARKIKIDEIELVDCLNNSTEEAENEADNYNVQSKDNNKLNNSKIIEVSFRVVCSKGTYIRVLCEDIAEKLGTVGYMKSLRRTRVGKFKIEDSGKFIEMKDILDVPNLEIGNLCFLEEQNTDNYEQDKICKDGKEGYNNQNAKLNLKKIVNGVKIKVNEKDGLVNLYNDGIFIGIGQVDSGNLKRKILI